MVQSVMLQAVACRARSDNLEPMLRSPESLARRSLGSVVVGAALMGAFAMVACGTDNGDTYTSPVPTTTPSSKDAGSNRPAFDAGNTSGNGDSGNPSNLDSGTTDPPDADPGNPDPPDPNQCLDPNDPGGTEPLAKVLANTDDSQNNPIVVKGVMNGLSDVDFYKFSVSDTKGHTMDTAFETPTKGIELCVWLSCQKGTANFKGCKGGSEDTSLAGRVGCCAAGPGTPSPDWECKGSVTHPVLDDSANIVVRVRQTADMCLPYSWSYNF